MAGPRYCPLCDERVDGRTCPIHDVPTIATGRVPGPVERLEVGTVLVGRYRIEGLLQQGGMGVLLSGTRLDDARDVVIKVLKGQRIRDLNNVRRFYTEARVAAALHHPNVVEILEFGVDEATRAPFLAMERVPGRTLKALLQKDGPLGERRAAGIFAQVAQALVVAHAQDVLHRDLKPSNIMVDGPEDHVKVLDFGLAKLVGPNADVAPLTQPGKTVGTPAFMSPEQVAQLPQDFRTDLYGLGCVLHAAVTGKPPFVGEDLIAVMRMQLKAETPELPPLLADGRAPSAELVALFRRLMAKHPADRPGSTQAVVDGFAALASRPPSAQLAAPTEVSVPKYVEGDTTESSFSALRPESDVSTGRAFAQDTLAAAPTEQGRSPEAALDAEVDAEVEDATERGTFNWDDTQLGPPPTIAETSADDLDTPLATVPAMDLEASDAFSGTDDLVTAILPQGLDALPEETEEGPILGDSLLAPSPWPLGPTAQVTPAAPVARAPAIEVRARPRDPAERRPTPRPEPVAPARRRQGGWLFAALLVAALLVGLAAGSLFDEPPAPRTVTAPAPPRPAAVERRAEGPDSRPGIRVVSHPDGARVFVEGQMRGSTPLWLPRPVEGDRLRVRVERDGFAPRAVELREDSPTRLELTLTCETGCTSE